MTAGKLMIFWDYDTQWGADRSRLKGGRKRWGSLEFTNTERLLELHELYRIQACFAVVGAAALPGLRPYHDPRQIRRIYQLGHEIASHSMYHSWLPGIGYKELVKGLIQSKDVLEQCIGGPVISFVPPFNQPFDYLKKGSISLSERKAVKNDRVDIPRLCEALTEAGFLFARISYSPLLFRIMREIFRKEIYRVSSLERIGKVTCLRLNTPGGFNRGSLDLLERCVKEGGFTVVYGHPHSLHSGNSQDERYLIPFLDQVQKLRVRNQLEVLTPRALLNISS